MDTKSLKNSGLDQVGVQFSNSIDLVRTNDSQVRHSDHLRLRFFDDRDATEHVAIPSGIFSQLFEGIVH